MRECEETNRTREAGHLDEIQGIVANTLNSLRSGASLLAKIFGVGFIDWLGLGFVANYFDVVPVRTNDESGIVVRVVVRAQTRCTIVFATRLQSRAIESFDLLAILGRERQVKMRWLLLGLVQAQ